MSRHSTTLWSPNDTVKDAAESIGIANLPDDVAKAMAMDVEYRLHEVIEQARKFMRHSKRRTLSTRDISSALKVLNVEPLYGYNGNAPTRFRETVLGNGQTVYYVDEEEEVDLEKLISETIPKVPREPTYTAHWLAIEGVQPAIPQNPHIGEIRSIEPAVRGSQVTYSTSRLGQEADIKPLVKHMISKELQLYFDRIVVALTGPEQNQSDKQTALYSLRHDPGLHQLTPYFIQFAQEKISSDAQGSTELLQTMLDVLDALLANTTIFAGNYIHQIVPTILTVLVSKKIENGGYDLRDYAASLLKRILVELSDKYPALRPRLTRTLMKGFLDVQRPLESQYGIVRGIQVLGPEVTLLIIVANLNVWLGPITAKAEQADQQYAWTKLKQALLETLAAAPKNEVEEAVNEINK